MEFVIIIAVIVVGLCFGFYSWANGYKSRSVLVEQFSGERTEQPQSTPLEITQQERIKSLEAELGRANRVIRAICSEHGHAKPGAFGPDTCPRCMRDLYTDAQVTSNPTQCKVISLRRSLPKPKLP